jgi:hypothetical protein
MKSLALALAASSLALAACCLALAACQSKSSSPQPTPAPSAATAAPGSAAASAAGSAAAGSAATAPAAPAGAHVAELCQASLGVLDRASCPANDAGLRAAKTSLTGIINTMTQVGNADPTSYDITCARMLLALERDVGGGSGSAACALPIDAELRGKMQRTLDAYYNRRTDVTKTGDAASDDAIGKLAALRDAACDCRTSACIDALDAKLTQVPPLTATAPQAAKDLAGKLLDDSARCAERARMHP